MCVISTPEKTLKKQYVATRLRPAYIVNFFDNEHASVSDLETVSSDFCIIIYNKNSKGKYNNIASQYCTKSIYGDAIFFSGAELDESHYGKYITPQNSFLPSVEFSDSFMAGVERAITKLNNFLKMSGLDELCKDEVPRDVTPVLNDTAIPTFVSTSTDNVYDSSLNHANNVTSTYSPFQKKKIHFDAQKLYDRLKKDEEPEEENEEKGILSIVPKVKFTRKEYDDILGQAYKKIEKLEYFDLDREYVIFQDEMAQIIIDKTNAKDTIEFLMGYFETREEYEKCAKLRDTRLV